MAHGHSGTSDVIAGSSAGAALLAALLKLVLLSIGLQSPVAVAAGLSLPLRTDAGREVPVDVVYPDGGCDPCTLVVFSHGAFATPGRYQRVLDAWAARGYVIASPLHVDSELYSQRDDFDGPAALRARLEDFHLLVTSPELREALAEVGAAVSGPIIAAGHSYGGLIAQVAAGASLQPPAEVPRALREAAAQLAGVVALSPPGPLPSLVQDADWTGIAVPMLVVTGTTDILPGFIDDWQLHLRSFEVAGPAPAYALVFAQQDHYFNGAFGRPREQLDAPTDQALKTLNALTADFMDDLVAGALPPRTQWLDGSGDALEARFRAAGAAHLN